MTGICVLILAAALSTAAPAARKLGAGAKASVGKPAPGALKGTPAVRRWMKTMTLRDEIAQLIFISFHGAAPNSRSREYRNFIHQIQDNHIGGLVLVNWSNG